jgi:predicted Fe-S protein YdhL (DUF1289 family)
VSGQYSAGLNKDKAGMSDAEMRGAGVPMVPSPCVGVCTLRGDTCYGCGRTSDEIAAWADLSAREQAAVWAELPGRLAAFGFRSFRLAASHPVIATFIPRTLTETTGRWRIVTPAVEGQWTNRPDDQPAADVATAVPDVKTDLRLKAHEKIRVFGFQRGPDGGGMDTAVFVLPKGLAAREAESLSAPPEFALELTAPDRYARAWLVGDGLDVAALARDFVGLDWAATAARLPGILGDQGIRLRIASALGEIETRTPVLPDEPPAEDANAPADIKISNAFVAGAVFEADDPEWLAKALAPL